MAACASEAASGEGHVPVDTAGAYATRAAGLGTAVPRVVGSVGGADVQVVADADDPHRHRRTEASIRPGGRKVELVGVADAAQLVVGPGGHHSDPTRNSDLIARRSSMAA
jgi:hypothetical protein